MDTVYCNYCGEEILLDSNNSNDQGIECYFGEDRHGKDVIICPCCQEREL